MRDEYVLTKAAQQKIDRLEAEIRRLEDRRDKLRRKVKEVECGQSPIKPGDVIRWESRSAKATPRRGRVISVSARYNGFIYRCHILTKAGKVLGYAEVGPDRQPVLDIPE